MRIRRGAKSAESVPAASAMGDHALGADTSPLTSGVGNLPSSGGRTQGHRVFVAQMLIWQQQPWKVPPPRACKGAGKRRNA